MITAESNLGEVLNAYDFGAPVKETKRYGSGHINDTFLATTQSEDGESSSFIVQRISDIAFKDLDKLMNNIIGVTEYMTAQLEKSGKNPSREVMRIIKTADGKEYYTDSLGKKWRACYFVPDTVCYQQVESAEIFESASRAFGNFQRILNGYPVESLFETIPRFHDTEDRLQKLKEAISKDNVGRVKECKAEIEFALSRESDCSVALEEQRKGNLPVRVTHNDTKLNNVLVDRNTNQAICVIDLDTTMPGLSINDFGDLIRFGANHSAEDEKDLTKVNFDISLYESAARGFIDGTAGILTPTELEFLPWGARLMTLECGIRFLTDYLSGDTYFRTHYPEQNLDRTRTQFKLVKDMEEQFSQMQQIVEKYSKKD